MEMMNKEKRGERRGKQADHSDGRLCRSSGKELDKSGALGVPRQGVLHKEAGTNATEFLHAAECKETGARGVKRRIPTAEKHSERDATPAHQLLLGSLKGNVAHEHGAAICSVVGLCP